ncbi:S-layer homology domain-containing protein [Candidatus Dojkabacteria bacterium]|uniref:S-layer homology domain-containing protein n=1 Tax=Candidatus Dojkabacteria bacterium TaxID=2099670 RepID=A0A955RKT1_9BACT|nr:S-layer homology domain-containing protein [Candidatus Dojkabacteria bacterium]
MKAKVKLLLCILSTLSVLGILFWSHGETQSNAISEPQLVLSDTDFILSVEEAVHSYTDENFAPTSYEIQEPQLFGSWAIFSVVATSEDCFIDSASSFSCYTNALGYHDGGNWDTALAGSTKFSEMIQTVPNTILTERAKAALDPNAPFEVWESYHHLPFPDWKYSVGRTFNSWHGAGYHDDPNDSIPDDPNFEQYDPGNNNLDFVMTGGDITEHWILSTASGTVLNVCTDEYTQNIRIRHDDGLILDYFHAEVGTVPERISVGARVVSGEFLGIGRKGSIFENATPRPKCGVMTQGDTTSHVHLKVFRPHASSTYGNAPGFYTFDGWTIQFKEEYLPTYEPEEGEDPELPHEACLDNDDSGEKICNGSSTKLTSRNKAAICDDVSADIPFNQCWLNTIVLPVDHGHNQGYIETFSNHMDQGGLPVGKVRPDSVGLTTGNYLYDDSTDRLFLEVFWLEQSYEILWDDRPINPITGAQYSHRDSVWVNQADIREVKESIFSDVSPAMPEYRYVIIAEKVGALQGYSDKTFNGQYTLNRGQWALVLFRLQMVYEEGQARNPRCEDIGLTGPGDCGTLTERSFPDIFVFNTTTGDGLESIAIEWLGRGRTDYKGDVIRIFKGYSDGTFKRNLLITRAEFATTLDKTLRLFQEYEGQEIPNCHVAFSDVDLDNPHREYILELCGLKIMIGDCVDKFNPDLNIRRMEIARASSLAFLMVYDWDIVEYIGGVDYPPGLYCNDPKFDRSGSYRPENIDSTFPNALQLPEVLFQLRGDEIGSVEEMSGIQRNNLFLPIINR